MDYTNFKEVIARSPHVFIIGVAGDSGSGKTTFTRAIREIFGEELVATITLDDYHTLDRARRRELGITPLAPEANDLDLLVSHLRDLKAGKTIKKPVYNHILGTIEPPVSFSPAKILILEGLHTLFTPALRAMLDFSLFVDPDEDVKRAWKIRRDMKRRGYGMDEVIEEMETRRSDYRKFIAPQRKYADTIIAINPSHYGEDLGDRRNIYRVTLYWEKFEQRMDHVSLSIDLVALLSLSDRNFLLEFNKPVLDGREMGALTFDGELAYDVIRRLEQNVEIQTGVHPISIFTGRDYVTPTDIIQLILSWRIIHERILVEFGVDRGYPA